MFVILDYTGDVVGEVMNGDRLFDHLLRNMRPKTA